MKHGAGMKTATVGAAERTAHRRGQVPAGSDPGTPSTPRIPRRDRRRSVRRLIVLGCLVVIAVAAATLVSGRGGTRLDPGSAAPDGARALAELLRDRGLSVERVPSLAPAERGAPITVVVPTPVRLSPSDVGDVNAVLRAGGQVVLVAPVADELPGLSELPQPAAAVGVAVRSPDCPLPEAQTAGSALAGGLAYKPSERFVSCYPVSGQPTLLAGGVGPGRVVVVGSADFMTNDKLADEGNAALALGLLSHERSPVRWLMPAPGTSAAGRKGLLELLPDSVPFVAGQLLLAAALLAFALGRRLGPVVAEPLPAVVRAAESAEGRARLYEAARARGQAAAALRTGARHRIGATLGVSAGAQDRDPAADPAALVAAVHAATGRPSPDVTALLYGPASGGVGGGATDGGVPDDAALVRLTADLDALERQVSRR